MLYKELLKEWLYYKGFNVRTSTRKNYGSAIRIWINPHFGEMELDEIKKKDIQDFFNGLIEKYENRTISNMSKVLSQSFKYAVENGYLGENPYIGCKIPKGNAIKEIKVFTEQEVGLLVKNCKLKYQADMILLSYRTGMRIGEILALKWADINFEQEFLTVRRTLSDYYKGKPEFAEPKTKSSRRRIELDGITMEMLHRRNSADNREFVFCKIDGSVYSRQCMHLNKICADAEIKPRSFHALRHTHASVLLSHGVHPKIVQERLGHSNIGITLDTYSHLIPSMQKVVVEVFNNLD